MVVDSRINEQGGDGMGIKRTGAGLGSALLVLGAGIASSAGASSVTTDLATLLGERYGYEHVDVEGRIRSRFAEYAGMRRFHIEYTLIDDISGTSWTWMPGGRGGESESLGHLIKTLRTTGGRSRADFSVAVNRVADVAAVPVPAAMWLFGTGLVGLMTVAFRRK